MKEQNNMVENCDSCTSGLFPIVIILIVIILVFNVIKFIVKTVLFGRDD